MGGTGSNQNTSEASNRWRTYPNNFLYSGAWLGSVADGRGIYGYYWSRTANSSFYAYGLYFRFEGVDPGTGFINKNGGSAVRCLAQ